ncbi:PQQ-binding-like beta-propeller repeat protein [Micromonospora sp. WMMD980]|uniref:outer membrane protein assembly factor BamB family protein n=1 Tax=Micromonospora sp. WMMD980 TaxID=3016088 RepID=UPI002416876A|nr:PQQ-binding-like beta-propeller repeat protein [Micromonospora sp. WMMD980]MDG4802141.1 PQQ-binding-like beta-propeller repeat protein [Micromonospora sp. WMMD980]
MSPVIDLGEMRHAEDGDEPLPAPPRRPPGRTARAVALGCLVLLTLAGAAGPARQPAPARVPAPQGAVFVALAGRLVVADGPGAVQRGGREVTAFRLPGGEPAWRFTLPAGAHVLGLTVGAGGLLVTSSPTGVGDTVVTLLDPTTGAVRWRQSGYPIATATGGLLVENPRPGGTGSVRSVDPASGVVRWSLPVPAQGVSYRREARGVTQLVLVEPDGRVAVHDADSGARLRAGRVSSVPDGVSHRFAQVVGGLLLVDDGAGAVTAYGLDRLDRLWTVPVDPRAGIWFTDCAGVICRRDQVGGAVALDPATGRSAWTDEGWLGFAPVGDRLIAATAGDGPELDLWTLEPATGRVLARLGRWRVTGRDDGSGTLAGLLGLRRLTGDRTLVGALDVPAGEARVRAVLPGSWDECADAGEALVCLRPAGGLAVWPVVR